MPVFIQHPKRDFSRLNSYLAFQSRDNSYQTFYILRPRIIGTVYLRFVTFHNLCGSDAFFMSITDWFLENVLVKRSRSILHINPKMNMTDELVHAWYHCHLCYRNKMLCKYAISFSSSPGEPIILPHCLSNVPWLAHNWHRTLQSQILEKSPVAPNRHLIAGNSHTASFPVYAYFIIILYMYISHVYK